MARKSRKNIETNISNQVSDTLKTVMYLRLSVEDKETSSSIDNQREIIKNYIINVPKLELVGEYVDNGKTGTNFKRAGFLKMIEAVENGEIECIIVKDLSRFGRNMIDTGHYIEKFLPTHNVRFIAINDCFDSDNKETSGLILPLKNIINETYARDVSFKVRKEVKDAMKRGELINSKAPFGYIRIREGKEIKYVVDPETSVIVKKMFEFAVVGLTPTMIKKRLNDEEIPTPTAYRRKQGVLKADSKVSGKWSSQFIKRILTNEVYIGNLVQGTRSKIGGKDINLPREDWIIFENRHEPIIAKDIFYEVQRHFEMRASIKYQNSTVKDKKTVGVKHRAS